VLCAPMALIAGGRLVAAVSDAGGLGILGGGYAGALGGEPDLEKELALVRGRKFGVGFITWALERASQALEAALKHSPYCVFLSFGEPKERNTQYGECFKAASRDRKSTRLNSSH